MERLAQRTQAEQGKEDPLLVSAIHLAAQVVVLALLLLLFLSFHQLGARIIFTKIEPLGVLAHLALLVNCSFCVVRKVASFVLPFVPGRRVQVARRQLLLVIVFGEIGSHL